MKAIRYVGKYQLGHDDVSIPVINKGEALIRVGYAGICGSDLYVYSGAHPRAKAPVILGHEFAGEIAELPADYKGTLQVGDLVAVNPLLTCGECLPCRTGNSHVCRKLGLWGIDADGGIAEYAKVYLPQIVKLPPGMTAEQGAIVEPVAVAVHAVRSSALTLGDSVLVIGGGPIGFLTAFVAKAAGAAQVIVVEPNEFRRNLIASTGLHTLPSVDKDTIINMTGGNGADVVFECAGVPATIEAAVACSRIRGQVVVVGVFKHPAPVDLQRINFAEISMIGVRVYTHTDFEYAVDLIARYPDITKVITHKLPLAEAQQGMDLMKLGGNNLKILLQP